MKSSQLGADVLYDYFSFCSQMADMTLQILDLLPHFHFFFHLLIPPKRLLFDLVICVWKLGSYNLPENHMGNNTASYSSRRLWGKRLTVLWGVQFCMRPYSLCIQLLPGVVSVVYHSAKHLPGMTAVIFSIQKHLVIIRDEKQYAWEMKNQIWSAKCWHPNWKQWEVAYHCLRHAESVCLSPSRPQLTGKHILRIPMNAFQFYFGGKGWVCRELVIKYWHSLSSYHLNELQTAFKSLFYWA